MKRLWALIAFIALVLASAPSSILLAQGGEGGAAESTSTPAGIGILILFLGITAIGIVGVYYISQNRSTLEAEKKAKEQ
ncbi:MAG: hypothetical protein OHK0023_26750 [Anaerolineae bacterium]